MSEDRAIVALTAVPANRTRMPICCIDLGFSAQRTTTGIATKPPVEDREQDEIDFGSGVKRVTKWLDVVQSNGGRECILLIEAPLSRAMTKGGNPCHRLIELPANYEEGSAPRSPKGWYYQAGANLSIAVVLFLDALKVPNGVKVHLVEGFYCSYKADEPHPGHAAVAKHFLDLLVAGEAPELVAPLAETKDAQVSLLPGMPDLARKLPHVLLRKELQLKSRSGE